MYFYLRKCKIIHVCCFKPLCGWWFVPTATGIGNSWKQLEQDTAPTKQVLTGGPPCRRPDLAALEAIGLWLIGISWERLRVSESGSVLGLWLREAKPTIRGPSHVKALTQVALAAGDQEDRAEACCHPILTSPCFSVIHSPGLFRHFQRPSGSLLSRKQMSWQGPVRAEPRSRLCEPLRCLCHPQAAVGLPSQGTGLALSPERTVSHRYDSFYSWMSWSWVRCLFMYSLAHGAFIEHPVCTQYCGDDQALSLLPKR